LEERENAREQMETLPGCFTTFNRHKARPLFEEQTSTPLATQENTEDKQEEMDVHKQGKKHRKEKKRDT
jgi:hypothetical protein